jgi:hypothetical protein
MEIADWNKSTGWAVDTIRNQPNSKPEGYIVKFMVENGREIRICCTPEELDRLRQVFENVLKQEQI